jgi:hypothetical protein
VQVELHGTHSRADELHKGAEHVVRKCDRYVHTPKIFAQSAPYFI